MMIMMHLTMYTIQSGTFARSESRRMKFKGGKGKRSSGERLPRGSIMK